MRSTSHRSLRRNRSNIHGQRRGREMNLQVALERHIDRTSAPTRVDRDHDLLEALRRHEPMAAERLVSTFGERGCHAEPVADWSPAANDPAVQVELRTTLSAAIDELPAAYRAVLVLRDIEGRSNAEVAEALGLNIGVVRTRAHRARLFLRKRLDDCMTDIPAAA